MHPRGKCIYNPPFLLAGGPPAPALRGVDWRHRENLLQKSPQRRKEGEGFSFLNVALSLLHRGPVPGTTSFFQDGLGFSREEGNGGAAVSLP